MAKSKKKRRGPNRTATRKPVAATPAKPRPAPGVARLRAGRHAIGNVLGGVSPDQLVPLLLPFLWLQQVDGMPGNMCVDSVYTLRYAYAQFGIRTEIMPVDLVIQDSRSGAMVMHGTPNAGWNGDQYEGHCVIRLPDDGRFMDPTVEQYPEVSRLRLGPVSGRIVLSSAPVATDKPIPAETHFAVARKHLLLVYTAGGPKAAAELDAHPLIQETQPQYQRTGINLASLAMVGLSDPTVIDRARQTPHPRLHALLDALAEQPHEVTDDGDWYYLTPEPRRLNEIPLPPDTPPIPL